MWHSMFADQPYGWATTSTNPFLIRLSITVVISFAFPGVDSFLRIFFTFNPFPESAFPLSTFVVIFVDVFRTAIAAEILSGRLTAITGVHALRRRALWRCR